MNDIMEVLVELLEARVLRELAEPSVSLVEATMVQVLLCLLSQLHHCDKLAVDGDISNSDGLTADKDFAFCEVLFDNRYDAILTEDGFPVNFQIF